PPSAPQVRASTFVEDPPQGSAPVAYGRTGAGLPAHYVQLADEHRDGTTVSGHLLSADSWVPDDALDAASDPPLPRRRGRRRLRHRRPLRIPRAADYRWWRRSCRPDRSRHDGAELRGVSCADWRSGGHRNIRAATHDVPERALPQRCDAGRGNVWIV